MKLFFLTIIFFSAILLAKPPELTPLDAKLKIEQIFKEHVNHKAFTPELMQRTIKNFLSELDPSGTYLVYSEINKWDNASDELLNQMIHDFKRHDFSEFESLHEAMTRAIERRRALEAKLLSAPLPNDASMKEFKKIEWVKTTEDLEEKLLKIKALQLDTAKTLEPEVQENFFARLEKRRLHREEAVLANSPAERRSQTLVYFLKAASNALDSHTSYFTPQEARQFIIEIDQRLFGIGAQLRDDLNGLTVIRLIDGGPAQRSKSLKIGDRIIAVNNDPIIGWDITDAVELIRGKKGTPVQLTVLREHKEGAQRDKIDIKIMRDEIVLKETRYDVSVEPFGAGVIAHINLYSFYQDPNTSATTDIKKVILDLKSKYQTNLYGIILDLRNNPGGLLTQGIGVTSLFISKGVVVSIKDDAGRIRYLRNMDSNKVWDGPLFVLTNRASASAAEIVAQTLQDYGRALIIGDDTTFGKGTYQIPTFDPGGKVNPKGEHKTTRGMYFTVSGKSPQLVGARADIVIPGPLTALDVGERFVKFPVDNDQIPPKFHDDLSDVPPFQRRKIKAFYEQHLQPRLCTYEPYLPTLHKNAEQRIESSPNYQNFLKAIHAEDMDIEELEAFGQNDMQLEEAYNVMKDLIMLMSLQPPLNVSKNVSVGAS